MASRVKPRKIHYASSPDPNPICEQCGLRIDPGRTEEPYTRSLTIWSKPPLGFYPCALSPPEEE